MKVMVTGGCGYKGSVLVPKLLSAGHRVTVWDAGWFGCNLAPHPGLTIVTRDLRDDIRPDDVRGHDAVVHLAGIANDPCGELDAKLTWEVNVLATMRLADAAARASVNQFIFASSASVYGLKDNEPVDEQATMSPVSDYNKTKMVAERVLLSYANQMNIQILRPATVCGVSPRMRLDTMVNMLTVQALEKRMITAHCGEHGAGLMRPNVHIQDVTDAYMFLLDRPHLIGAFNCGFENISAGDTAQMIADTVEAEIEITTVKDKRSYAVSSAKIIGAGFRPRKTVADAVSEIVSAYRRGEVLRDERSVNLLWMRVLGVVA